jgi:hypothetical protein
MKTIKMIIVAILAVAFTTTISAQGAASKTETIKVSGNCEMCKSTIEKAAKVVGVAKADWSTKTKMLTLVYNPAKVKSDNVQKKIAAAGYDTPKYKATAATYASLPGCCKYR